MFCIQAASHKKCFTSILKNAPNGQQYFSFHFSQVCRVENCYLTTNKSLLNDVSEFDALLFHMSGIPKVIDEMPVKRAQKHQLSTPKKKVKPPLKNIAETETIKFKYRIL